MKKFLSHTSTKHELSCFFAEKVIEYANVQNLKVVVAYSDQCKATFKDVFHLQSCQEEADTKLLLCAKDATISGASKVDIHSPNTDVFILAIRRYPQLCENSFFVTGKGSDKKAITLQTVYDTLGQQKCSALPGLHAFSGADITGSFAGKGKVTCWNAFEKASEDILKALKRLGCSQRVPDENFLLLEKFVCQLYCSNARDRTVAELRWLLFKKNQATSEKLPATRDALHQGTLRAHYQSMTWVNDVVPNPDAPSPREYGWTWEGDRWCEVMCTKPPAPDAVLNLVKCNCVKSKCAVTNNTRCTCRMARLNCTKICGCIVEDEECGNFNESTEEHGEHSDTEDEDDEDGE